MSDLLRGLFHGPLHPRIPIASRASYPTTIGDLRNAGVTVRASSVTTWGEACRLLMSGFSFFLAPFSVCPFSRAGFRFKVQGFSSQG